MIGELTAANIFAIQTEIATAVADAVAGNHVVNGRAETFRHDPHRKHGCPMKRIFAASNGMEKRTSAALAEAVDDFNRAIELDPSFALAYVGLADSYGLQVDLQWSAARRDACESASRDRQGTGVGRPTR